MDMKLTPPTLLRRSQELDDKSVHTTAASLSTSLNSAACSAVGYMSDAVAVAGVATIL